MAEPDKPWDVPLAQRELRMRLIDDRQPKCANCRYWDGCVIITPGDPEIHEHSGIGRCGHPDHLRFGNAITTNLTVCSKWERRI